MGVRLDLPAAAGDRRASHRHRRGAATGRRLSFLPLVLLFHEHPVHWSLRGVLAILYLVMFGSIVGYSAYIFALDRLPVAIVSIYPYVNSVVAVTLGWLFYREPFGAREAAAMAIIFAEWRW
jgi:drug/metabolite transporter (DMT)-like permease